LQGCTEEKSTDRRGKKHGGIRVTAKRADSLASAVLPTAVNEEYEQLKQIIVAIVASLAGAGLVLAAFNFSFLNWVVDVPGSLVRLVVPINFHEGQGAFGFFLAIFLSWLLSTIMTWILVLVIHSVLTWFRSRMRLHFKK